MNRMSLVFAALSAALLAATWNHERPGGRFAGEDELRSTTGRDSNTVGFPADCAYSSLAQGQVVNCPQQAQPAPAPPPVVAGTSATAGTSPNLDPPAPAPVAPAPQCVMCNNGSYTTNAPPELGGNGGFKPNGTQNCANSWKRIGTCQPDGSCGNPRFVQFCAGNPTNYTTQL